MPSPRLIVSLLLVAAIVSVLPAQGEEARIAELERAATAAFENGQHEEAVASFREILKRRPDDDRTHMRLGFSLHMLGRLDEALAAHKKAAESTNPDISATATYNVACVYALKKDKDQAFAWIEKAMKAGFNRPEHMAQDSDLDALRDDPRYAKLVEAMTKAAASDTRVQAFAQKGDRGTSRIAYFGSRGGAGQLSVSYGRPRWKSEFETQIASEKMANRRWRLGKDFWTVFDTSLPVDVGGTRIAPGSYYLTLERRSNGDYVLAFLDPAAVRAQKLDPFQAADTKGGHEARVTHATSDDVAETLEINLAVDPDDQKSGALVIRFGPHELKAPLAVQLDTPPAKN